MSTHRWAVSCFFSLYTPCNKAGFLLESPSALHVLLSRCLCAWCARNLSLASSLHTPLNILQSDLVCWHIMSWSFKRASLTAMGQNHEGGFQLPEAILYSSVLWSVESFSDQTCTWCIVSRQNAKKVGVYWHCNWVHNGGCCATQGNKCCCICFVSLWLFFLLKIMMCYKQHTVLRRL